MLVAFSAHQPPDQYRREEMPWKPKSKYLQSLRTF